MAMTAIGPLNETLPAVSPPVRTSRSSSGRARKEATALWSIQLAVNGLWPVLFFLLGAHGPAFFWLVGLIVLVLFMIADFSRRNAAAAWLSAPYLLWLLFAAYLNLGIWLLNQ